MLVLVIITVNKNIMKLKKGSKEAKAFMAKIRAMKGTTKKVGNVKKMPVFNPYLPDDDYSIRIKKAVKKLNKKTAIKKVTPKKVGSTLKFSPKETRLGATDKDLKTRSKSYHKDTKSHNVKISVMSGINGIIISDIKYKYDSLNKWNKVLDNLNNELKKTIDKGLKAAIKIDIYRVKNVIKDIKKDITSSQKKVK